MIYTYFTLKKASITASCFNSYFCLKNNRYIVKYFIKSICVIKLSSYICAVELI